MAWTTVNKTSEEFLTKSDNTATGTRVHYCESDSVITADDLLTASAGGTAVPAANEAWSVGQPRCLADTRACKLLSPYQGTVTTAYAAPLLGAFTDEDLLSLPARISETSDNFMEEYTLDENDPQAPVRNAAGEPFDKGPERLNGVKRYTIKKYVDDSTKAAIEGVERQNNPTTLTIRGRSWEEDTLLLESCSFDDVSSGIYDATIIVKGKKDGWKDKALNIGFSELVDGERKDITQKDASGNDVAVPKPWPLNEDGTKKASPTDDIDELTFWPYQQADWSGVPLS